MSDILFPVSANNFREARQDAEATAKASNDIAEALKEALAATIELNKQNKEVLAAKEQENRLNKLEANYQKLESQHAEKKSKFSINFVKASKERVKAAADEVSRIQEQLKLQEEILEVLQEQGKETKETQETIDKLKSTLSSANSKANAAQRVSDASGIIVNAAKSSADSLISSVDSAMSIYSQYMGRVTARLQSLDASSEKTFDSIRLKYSTLVSSPYVNQRTLYENIDRLSSEGISYNIEERAFLASLADKMVNSFDVGNATLTRLIRLYQEDFTQAMLGSESWLTQLFNMMYEDTSYLKNVDDSILSALTDVMSTMDRADALNFQYEVQKWLGSMYEVGMSSEAITQIASALNALGTGNAAGFKNSGVGTLLNLAIARSDYSLADILTQGLNGEAVNDILESVVQLLIDIKDNTSNQATLNAYAGVMGLSLSDIRGAYNLKSDLPTLWSQTMNLENAEKEVGDQIKDIINTRTSLQEKINNLVDNYSVKTAIALAADSSSYLKWILGKTLVSVGSTIPGMVGSGISIAGYLDLVAQMAKGFNQQAITETSMGDYMDETNSKGAKSNIVNFFENIKDIFNDWNNADSLLGFLTNTTNSSIVGTRGANYSVIKPSYGTVSKNISSSYGVTSSELAYLGQIVGADTGGAGIQNLERLADQSGYGYDVFSTESENEGYNEYDIFEELFYHQEHPIKVHLAYFDDDAEAQLIDYINNQDNNSNLRAIRGKVEGTIRVDTEEFSPGDISRVINAIQSAG